MNLKRNEGPQAPPQRPSRTSEMSVGDFTFTVYEGPLEGDREPEEPPEPAEWYGEPEEPPEPVEWYEKPKGPPKPVEWHEKPKKPPEPVEWHEKPKKPPKPVEWHGKPKEPPKPMDDDAKKQEAAACRYCDLEQLGGSKFCRFCGRNLSGRPPAPVEQKTDPNFRPNPRHARRTIPPALLLIPAVLIPVALVLCFWRMGSLQISDAALPETQEGSGPAEETRYYVMESGSNYHLEDCSILRGMDHLTCYKRKEDAEKDGYAPCVCVLSSQAP